MLIVNSNMNPGGSCKLAQNHQSTGTGYSCIVKIKITFLCDQREGYCTLALLIDLGYIFKINVQFSFVIVYICFNFQLHSSCNGVVVKQLK